MRCRVEAVTPDRVSHPASTLQRLAETVKMNVQIQEQLDVLHLKFEIFLKGFKTSIVELAGEVDTLERLINGTNDSAPSQSNIILFQGKGSRRSGRKSDQPPAA